MEIRTLAPGEQEDLLSLLDGWPMTGDWTGREFFRRYVEKDPTFEDRNVWVAVDSRGELESCVQIFPRNLLLWGDEIRCGGIGSVFTRPERRREGLAEALLSAATAAMKQRGLELSLLFASRIAWYTKLGWRQFQRHRALVDWAGTPKSGAGTQAVPEVRPVDIELDLAALEAMAQSGELAHGRVVRDTELWRASRAVAGDPDEDFWVADRNGTALAYARGTFLEGNWHVTEWGRGRGEAATLAALLGDLMSGERSPFVLGFCDEPLARALRDLGAEVRTESDPDMMVRCLDVEGMARRLGVEPRSEGAMSELLVERLGMQPYCFWAADRF